MGKPVQLRSCVSCFVHDEIQVLQVLLEVIGVGQ